MKKFLFKVLQFFIAVVVLDIIYGFACQYMNDHSKGGGVKSRYYVCKESNEEVLIFGSSRAKHHYVPDIIEDSLGMTCYNTGEDGNGIILCYGFLKMITQRYSPKLIIYDVTGFDIYEDDNIKYLDLLKPYYHEPGVDSIFWAVNPKTRFMMLSNLYRYNTTCMSVLGNYIHPMTNYPKGYCALYKTMDYEPVIRDSKKMKVDSLKLRFFEQFIQLSERRGIQLFCCISPTYKAQFCDDYYMPIKTLCKYYNVPYLNDVASSTISCNKSLFQDRTHLNHNGASMYTRELVTWINCIYSRGIIQKKAVRQPG